MNDKFCMSDLFDYSLFPFQTFENSSTLKIFEKKSNMIEIFVPIAKGRKHLNESF